MTIPTIDPAGNLTGIIQAEQPDRQNEVLDFTAVVAAMTSFMEAGPHPLLREYADVVGTVTGFVADPDAKTITITAKVLDQTVIDQIASGVYAGFNFGGVYRHRQKEGENIRYELDVQNVSVF